MVKMNIDKDGGSEHARKELQQQKHYTYLSQLQNMSRELPVWVWALVLSKHYT